MAVSYDCVRSREFSAFGVGYGITEVVKRRFLDLRDVEGMVFCVMYWFGAMAAKFVGGTGGN